MLITSSIINSRRKFDGFMHHIGFHLSSTRLRDEISVVVLSPKPLRPKYRSYPALNQCRDNELSIKEPKARRISSSTRHAQRLRRLTLRELRSLPVGQYNHALSRFFRHKSQMTIEHFGLKSFLRRTANACLWRFGNPLNINIEQNRLMSVPLAARSISIKGLPDVSQTFYGKHFFVFQRVKKAFSEKWGIPANQTPIGGRLVKRQPEIWESNEVFSSNSLVMTYSFEFIDPSSAAGQL